MNSNNLIREYTLLSNIAFQKIQDLVLACVE